MGRTRVCAGLPDREEEGERPVIVARVARIMPLSNIDQFLDIVRKSGLLDESFVRRYMDRLRASEPLDDDPKQVANCMVRDAVLSQFQADQLVAGKWRGFHVAKYRVLEKIGIGGMGQVYLAEHKIMKHRVALKVLPRSKSADPSSLERFYREAKAGAAMDHTNIVRAFDIDFDQSSDLHYLVMEYVDGVSMQDLVKLKGPMPAARAAQYIYQTALGLEHAHAQGLIHRDIKPSNVLVERGGMIKILDMGLARFFNDDNDQITKKYDESVLGTADYLAPEQAVDSHAVDVRADIYSLGCTFYYMLSAQPPFGEGSVAQKLIWHQTRRPKPIKEHRPDLPDDIVAILDKMMAKSPAERYQTPREVADALQPYGSMPIAPPADDELPRLSPLARMAPDAKSPIEELATVGGGSSHKRDRPPTAAGYGDMAEIAAELRFDPASAPTKRSAESSRDTPSPMRPDKVAQSGQNRYDFSPKAGLGGSSPRQPALPGDFEMGPPGSAPAFQAETVRTSRGAVAAAAAARTASKPRPPTVEVAADSASRSLHEESRLKRIRILFLVFGIILVIVLVLLNVYLIFQAQEPSRPYRRGGARDGERPAAFVGRMPIPQQKAAG